MNLYKKAKYGLLVALNLWIILLLTGCGGGGKRTGTGTKKESDFTEDEKYGGVYRIAQQADPRTFDPCSMWDVSSHGANSALLYNGLVRFDMDGNIVPDLAEKWDVSPDGKIYTFYLRKNVKFHNGDLLTAKDIEFNYKRFLAEPRAYYKWLLDKVTGSNKFMKDISDNLARHKDSLNVIDIMNQYPLPGILVKDDSTLQLILDKPYNPFIKGLAMPEAYIASPRAIKEYKKDYPQNPVGTGPFKLKEWIQNGKVVFEAYRDYYEGRPYLDLVEITIINDETSIYNTYKSGQLESIGIFDAQFKTITEDPELKPYIVSRPELSVHAFGFGLERPYLNDKRIRMAINHAINRKEILEKLFNNRGTLATGPVPVGLPDYHSRVRGYPYDPEKAKQLLKEAGYPDGFDMKIWISESKIALELVQAIQSYLAQVGIKAEIVQNEWSTLHKAVLEGVVDATYPWVWSADYADAEDFLYPIYHSRNIPEGGNSGRYKNPEVDKILDQAHGEIDPDRVLELLHQAEALIIKDAPKVYLWYPITYAIHQPWVHNFVIPAIYNADKMNKVWLSNH